MKVMVDNQALEKWEKVLQYVENNGSNIVVNHPIEFYENAVFDSNVDFEAAVIFNGPVSVNDNATFSGYLKTENIATFNVDTHFNSDTYFHGNVGTKRNTYTGVIEDDAGQHGTWTMPLMYVCDERDLGNPIAQGYAHVSVTNAVANASELRFISSTPLDENIAILNFYLAYPGLGFRAYSARVDADHKTIRLLPDAGATISLSVIDDLPFMVMGIPAN